MKKISLALLILVFTQCQNSDSNPTTENEDSINKQKPDMQVAEADCYEWAKANDTVRLSLSRGTGVRNGLLVYDWAEKDKNKGKWEGQAAGDILMGWYNFESEGINSVRQVAWKLNGEELWPAIGEIKLQGDTAMFENPSQLKFDSSMAMKKIPCNN